MHLFTRLMFFSVLLFAQLGFSAVQVEPSNKSLNSSTTNLNQGYPESHQSALELKTFRKLGVGTSFAGSLGLGGANFEANFSPEDSFLAGLGGGSGYSAFSFQWKHTFEGLWLAPYTSLGYARWSSVSSRSAGATINGPRILRTDLLTEVEKDSGQFIVDLLTPSIGLQYFQLNGDYKGLSFYVEVVFLTSFKSFKPIPLGSLGWLYYF